MTLFHVTGIMVDVRYGEAVRMRRWPFGLPINASPCSWYRRGEIGKRGNLVRFWTSVLAGSIPAAGTHRTIRRSCCVSHRGSVSSRHVPGFAVSLRREPREISRLFFCSHPPAPAAGYQDSPGCWLLGFPGLREAYR